MNKVILISIDGMRPDGLLQCGNPFVQELMKRGTYTLEGSSMNPSVTLPCHMSIFHSVPPKRHGITTNTYAPMVRPVNGLFEQLRFAGKKSAMYYGWEPMRDVARPESLRASQYIWAYSRENTDRLLTEAALNYIQEEDSSNWFVSFSSCALSYIRECACHEFSPEMLVHPALPDLRKRDKENGTQYYETLRAFLVCERDIPQTSQQLIIHRTTLTYRLGRILEVTNLNLDDPNLRLYLLLSFHILDRASEGDI